MVAGLPVLLNPDCPRACTRMEEGGTGLGGDEDGERDLEDVPGLNGTLRL
jgi:hypothetical protein